MKLFKGMVLLLALSWGMLSLAGHKNKKDKFRIISSDASYEMKNGVELLKKNKLDKANKAFDKAISEFDLFYQAIAYKAIIAAQQGDLNKSKELFENSVRVFEKYKEFIITKRETYINQVKADEVRSRASSSVDHDQYFHRLQELKHELEADKAMGYDAFFSFKYGNTLMALKEVPQAKTLYLAAVSADPGLKDTYANLALVYFMEQDYEKALETFERGKELGTAFHPKFEETLRAQMKNSK
jgi:tetratricopeptide (TPR) repeat protein